MGISQGVSGYNPNSVAITGGTIDGTTIGGTTPVSIRGYMPSATTYSGTAHTLALADMEIFQICSNGSAQTITIPANATIAIPINSEIALVQAGAGQVIIAAAGGVTINSAGGNLKAASQYTLLTLKKTATDTWYLFGNLTS